MYKLRYGRTYNMGNYQSERFEVEHDFTDDTTIEDAVLVMAVELEKAPNASVSYLKQKKANSV